MEQIDFIMQGVPTAPYIITLSVDEDRKNPGSLPKGPTSLTLSVERAKAASGQGKQL